MSRRPDRKKHGKDSLIANSKDESDAATLRSSDIDMQLRSVQLGQTVVGDTRGSLLQSRENSTPFQLLSEMGNSEAKSPDSKSSIVESLNVLKTKIDTLLQKSGISDSSDKDSLELKSEMQKLLQATLTQKKDFDQLYETVRRQKEMLQRLEAMATAGSLRQPIASVDSTEVTAVQCCDDLETRADLDATIVLLISGRYEYHRKLLHSSDTLINVYIPDSVNLGNRVLPGRQSFPNSLMQSLTFDTSTISPLTQRPRSNGVGSELGAVGGGKELVGPGRKCPVCAFVFPLTETIDAIQHHVERHFLKN